MRVWAITIPFLTLTAAAQQAPNATFRAGTKLVQVDVVATNTNGPVAGLTKEDFTLLDNGKPQTISVFAVKSAPPKGHPTSPLPAGIVSNRVNRNGEALGAVTAILMDQKNLGEFGQGFAIQEIVKFIAARRKNDRIAIYALQREGTVLIQDLTDDDELLRHAEASLKPNPPIAGTEAVNVLTDRVRDTKRAFEAIAHHIANVPGRKSLIWISPAFPLVIPALSLDFTEDMQASARVLSDADVALYAVSPRGLDPATRGIYSSGFNTMDLMAERTGGEVFINTNDVAESMEEAVEDSDLVYTLGFYPPQDQKEGVAHKLKVETGRKGVSLRYRETYVSAKAQTVATDHLTVEQLLKESLDASQIELAARATPDPAHPGSYNVQVSVNLHDVQFQHEGTSWMGEIGVAFLVQGTEDIRVITRKIELPDKVLAAGLDKGTLIETSIMTQGSAGILRVAVQDHATGAAGSVKVPLAGK